MDCLYLHDKHARWMSPVSIVPISESNVGFQTGSWLGFLLSCWQYRVDDDDDDDLVVDPLNLLLALTLLGRDIDEDDEDYLDFPFYLSVEYDL